MDPQAAVAELNYTDDEERMAELLDALLGWAKTGGFRPPTELEIVGHTNPALNRKIKLVSAWLKGGS